MNLLAERVEGSRAELVGRYLQILQESLFANRAFVRPGMLKQTAAEEAAAVLSYLGQAGFSGGEHGGKLHQAGFNVGTVLKLNEVTRGFLLDHFEDHQTRFILEVVDRYQQAVIEGFIQGIDQEHRTELERMRTALRGGAG